MLKKNYAAWHINDHKFKEAVTDKDKLLFFARYAILAPSGHNSQPWNISVHQDKLIVTIHKSRFLSIDGSGLKSVEPFISIGSFLETLNLAARGFGYTLDVRLLTRNHIAEVRINGQINTEPELLTAIKTRVSNRNSFEQSLINSKLLSTLASIKLDGVGTIAVTKRNDINFVAEQTELAVPGIMEKPLYRHELSKWVRTNQTQKYDGMPGFTHGFGDMKSLVSKIAVRYAPKHGPQAKKSSMLISDSGALIIVYCTNDKKESYINAGRLYASNCILANKAGIATSALGAAVQNPATREIIKDHFGIKERPIYILRLGKAMVHARHAPRWPLEKILTK